MKRYESASELGLIRQVTIYEKLRDAIVWFLGRRMSVSRNLCLLNVLYKL